MFVAKGEMVSLQDLKIPRAKLQEKTQVCRVVNILHKNRCVMPTKWGHSEYEPTCWSTGKFDFLVLCLICSVLGNVSRCYLAKEHDDHDSCKMLTGHFTWLKTVCQIAQLLKYWTIILTENLIWLWGSSFSDSVSVLNTSGCITPVLPRKTASKQKTSTTLCIWLAEWNTQMYLS